MTRPDFREFQGRGVNGLLHSTKGSTWEDHNMNELYHYGIKRRSGRYPWGSGDRPYQSTGGPISKVKKKIQESDAKKYEKKEVARFRTGIERLGRDAVAATLGSIGGLAIGAVTANPAIGVGSAYLVTMGIMASPIGKQNIYFKK